MRRSLLRFCIVGTPAHPAPGLELQLQRDAGARKPAHDRSYWHTCDFGSLFVAEPIDSHEQQRGPLIRRQAIDRPPNLGESEARFDAPHRLVRSQPLLGDIAILLPDIPRADLVNPDRLHDAKHPAVETRPLLKLMLACEGALACRLNEIVGLDGGTREPAGEPTQPWQDRDQLVAKAAAHRISARNQTYRRSRQFLTKRQRTSRRLIPGARSYAAK